MNTKVLIVIVVLVVILTVGGYFGYKWYQKKKQSDTPSINQLSPNQATTQGPSNNRQSEKDSYASVRKLLSDLKSVDSDSTLKDKDKVKKQRSIIDQIKNIGWAYNPSSNSASNGKGANITV
jgi:predicted negative regulator of RcsB-dependent stress response